MPGLVHTNPCYVLMICIIERADPGVHAGTVEADGVAIMLVSVLITVVGIFYFAVILALIVDWIRDRMDSIKKGKGYIVERNHFLILGRYTVIFVYCALPFSGINFTWIPSAHRMVGEGPDAHQ